MTNKTQTYQLRQAKADQKDFDELLGFLQTIDDMADNGDDAEEIGAYVIDYFATCRGGGWQRVVWGYDVLVKNAADPELDYLDWKPEIKAILEEKKGM